MSALILPHSAIVYTASPTVASHELDAYAYSGGTTISCQITPESATAAFQDFGVDIQDASLLICDTSDASKFANVGTRVTYGGFEWRTKAHAKTYTGIGAADHCAVLIGRVES